VAWFVDFDSVRSEFILLLIVTMILLRGLEVLSLIPPHFPCVQSRRTAAVRARLSHLRNALLCDVGEYLTIILDAVFHQLTETV